MFFSDHDATTGKQLVEDASLKILRAEKITEEEDGAGQVSVGARP